MPEVSDCGKYLMLFIMKGCKDMLMFFSEIGKLEKIEKQLEFIRVVNTFEADYDVCRLFNDLFTV